MWWIWILILIIIIVLVIFLVFDTAVHKTIFQPDRKHKSRAKYPHREIWLPIDSISGKYYECRQNPNSIDLKLARGEERPWPKVPYIHAWHFNAYPNRKTVLFFHGNTGNISYRDYVIDICHKFKLNLLLVDYRGYGKSDGRCSISGVYRDSLTAYYYLVRNGTRADNIIVWGESLGGAAAIYVASSVKCGKLILLSSFSNLKELLLYYPEPTTMTRSLAGYIDYLTTPIPNNTRLTKVTCPVMIVHSVEDDLIGYECAKSLYNSVSHSRKAILTIKCGHSSPKLEKKHLETLLSFCTVDSGLEKDEDLDHTLNQLEIIAKKYQQLKHIDYSSSDSRSRSRSRGRRRNRNRRH